MTRLKRWQLQSPWQLQAELNAGAFARVHAAVNSDTQETAAVKVLDKRLACNRVDVLRAEIDIHTHVSQALPHAAGIVQLLDVFEDDDHVYLVLERCRGWTLSELLQRCGFFPEQYSAWVTQQVARALCALHCLKVVHRDIKPENLMFTHNSPGSNLKLIDFGLSVLDCAADVEPEIVGSPDFVAPEVLRQQLYSPACDMWALGVLIYTMLCGCPPFSNDMQIRMAPLRFYQDIWAVVGSDAKDLIKRLLNKDPQRRPTAAAVLQHRWLQQAEVPALQLQLTFNSLPMGRFRSKSCSACATAYSSSSCDDSSVDSSILRAGSPPAEPISANAAAYKAGHKENFRFSLDRSP